MSTLARRPRPTALGTAVGAIALPLIVGGAALGATTPPIPVGTPPVAVISVPDRIYAGVPITLSGARSTADGGVSEWEWNLDGKGRYERDSTSTPWVSRSFRVGKHTVALRVRSEAGLVATTSKQITVRRPPAAVGRPGAVSAVDAKADGTSVDVSWSPALGAPALAYRVTNVNDSDTDPIYVPATSPLSATFDGLVPTTYLIRVTAINAKGPGPAIDATATVQPKVTPSALATASATPTASTGSPAPTSSSAPTAAAATSSTSSKRTTGLVLIGVGIALLVVAGAAAVLGARRRGSA